MPSPEAGITLASPKSQSLTDNASPAQRKLSGFTSRCTTPKDEWPPTSALHEEVVDLDAMLQVCYALEDGCLRLDSLFPLCVELLQVASRFGVSVTPKIHDLHS
eukprot:CAMPEP_0115501344 /NCGR_PEP_ID=MMETSP0271-20121206/68343_1 /TAXON_ID=71861 /ORGANISM="Scrippsiella trochoidea, Strain CCMP3099" /LENGTH=103 /DNA_ID=CAMNT_0002930263 /DNA_START=964 /DNA_END=1276 /DNA_ORIENTATION=-